VNEGLPLQDGEQVLLIDQRGKRHLIFLRKSETFHSDRGWIPHEAVIGQPEGSWVRSSLGLRYLALRPTLAEYVLDMPRGAQVIYPKDLALILFWADVYPGCRVLEAGMGSGALTLALLRAFRRRHLRGGFGHGIMISHLRPQRIRWLTCTLRRRI